MSVRSSTARMTCAARSSGRICASAPPKRPIGVRTYPRTTASRGWRLILLSSLKPRRSLRRKGAHALGVVARAARAILQRRLELEEGREVAVPRRVQPLLRERVRLGRSRCQAMRVLAPLVRELGVGPHALHETDAQCLVRAHRFTGEDHVRGPSPPDDAWEEIRRPGIGHEADAGPRRAERRRRRRDTDVARDGDTEAGSGNDAVDRGDDRLAHDANRRDEWVITATQLVPEFELFAGRDLQEAVSQILAGRESAARSGDDDRTHGGVGRDVVDRERQRARERFVEGVENLGAVESDDGERATALETERPAHYFPLNVGLRLFTKASTPSLLSSVAKRR